MASYWYNFDSDDWSAVYKHTYGKDYKLKAGYDSAVRLGWASLWVSSCICLYSGTFISKYYHYLSLYFPSSPIKWESLKSSWRPLKIEIVTNLLLFKKFHIIRAIESHRPSISLY